jgi:hypothetical protein
MAQFVHDRVFDSLAKYGQPVVVELIGPDHGGNLFGTVGEPHAHPVVPAAVEQPHAGPEPRLGAITEELVEPVDVGTLLDSCSEAGGGRCVEVAVGGHEAVEVARADEVPGLVQEPPGFVEPPPPVEPRRMRLEGHPLC